MEAGVFSAALVCPACGQEAGAGARFCRSCGSALHNGTDEGATARAGAAADAAARASTIGDAALSRVQAAWQVGGARTALVGSGLTLVGVFLPWIGSFSLSTLTGWVIPVLGVLFVSAATIAYVTMPGRPGWVGMVAAGLSFVLAVLSTVVMAMAVLVAHAASGFMGALLGAHGPHVGLSIGGWVTVIAAVTTFLATLRLLLTTDAA